MFFVLTAQSSYLAGFQQPHQYLAYNWPADWQTKFGRSPECKSYAEVWPKGKYTFSGCGTNDAVVPASGGVLYPSQIPPGLWRKHQFQTWQCCGNCTLEIPEVRLFYFPDPASNEYCKSRNVTSGASNVSMTALVRRAPADAVGVVTAVTSGYTL